MVSSQPRTRSGLIRIRFSKNGTPYVLISREDARLLSEISPDWKIVMDYASNASVVITPETDSTTKAQMSHRTTVTSIRVGVDDWNWFKKKCRDEGTSTCREFRKWLHLAREDEMFPVTLKRGRGQIGYVR